MVLHQLYTLRFTGELALNTRAGIIQVYVRDGYPVYVNLSEKNDLLGRLMVEMRLLTEAGLRHSLATPPEPGERYGEVLLRLGLCDESQLRQALRAQVRRKLHRLFALTEGGYAAIPGEHNKGLQGGESLRVHPWRVIYHGVRSYPAERLRTLLQPLEDRAFCLGPQAAPESGRRYGFGAEENYLMELLRRGFWGLSELLETATLEPTLVQTVVYTLLATEQLEIGPADSQPRGREHMADLPPPPRPKVGVVELPIELRIDPPQSAKPPAVPERVPPPPAASPAPSPTGGQAPATSLPTLELETRPPPPSIEPPPPTDLSPVEADARSSPPEAGGTPRQPGRTEPAARPTSASAPAETPDKSPSGPSAAPPSRPTDPASPARGPQTTPVRPAPAQRPPNRPVSFEELALLRAEIESKAKVVEEESLFAVLGVSEDADAAAIKAAFLQGAKKFHPDRVAAIGLHNLRPQAEKIFRRLNEAHSVLSDPDKRQEYLAEQQLKAASGDRLLKEKELAVRAVHAELAFSRGTVFLRKRDYASAAREFEEALRLNPDEGEHVGYAAWASFCAGKLGLPEATKELVRAIRMSPQCGRLHYFLGVLLKQDGNEDKAYQSFKKAIELDERLEEAQSEVRLIESRRQRRGGLRPPSSPESKAKSAQSHKGDGKGDDKKRSLLDLLRQPIGKK